MALDETVAHKRLATIVAIDVAGYSARTEADEAASASEIGQLRGQIADACVRHGGRVFNTAGDGFMLEFPTVSGALDAADELAAASGPPIRVGVHLGEVRVAADGDLLGHGVNVAARIQALAPPRGVWVSADVKRAIRGPLADRLIDRGMVRLDKMDETIHVFALQAAVDPAAQPAWTGIDPVIARRGLIGAGAAVVVVGAAGLAAYRALRSRSLADPLVAVLPFDNLSPDAQLGYFADGLSEDIVNALIKGGGVRVTSSTSSFTFRGAAKAKAGQVLKADYLLDGSVLREDARLRVNAHLIRVSDQQTMWSDSYDRDAGQELQLEDEIAARVTIALKQQFMAAANAATQLVDATAYDLYLRGRQATRNHTPESIRQGGDLLREAVRRAPNFAAAWYELADNYYRTGFVVPHDQQEAGFKLGLQAAQRAFALDPRNGAAIGLISQLLPGYGHWGEIDAGLMRGLAISPVNADLDLWRGNFLMATGRINASVAFLKQAQALDPLELFHNHSLCVALTFSRQFPDALAMSDRIMAIWPNQLAAFWDRFWLFVAWERWPDAQATLGGRRPNDVTDEYEVFKQALKAIANGSAASGQAARARLLTLGQAGLGYSAQVMTLLARLGFADDAVMAARATYLGQGDYKVDHNVQFAGNSRYPMHGEADVDQLFHPFMASIRRSGRLNEIFDGIGLTAYWRQSGPPDA